MTTGQMDFLGTMQPRQPQAHEPRILQWLAALAWSTGTGMTDQQAGRIAEAYIPPLADAYAAPYFTDDSRSFVALRCKKFPAVGTIADLLDQWGKGNAAGRASGANSATIPGLSLADSNAVDYYRQRATAAQAETDRLYDERRVADPLQTPIHRLRSMIRAHFRGAWDHLVATDPFIAEAFNDNRPAKAPSRAVSAAVEGAVGHLAAAAPARPPQPAQAPPQPAERATPLHLSAAQLAAAYAARGRLNPRDPAAGGDVRPPPVEAGPVDADLPPPADADGDAGAGPEDFTPNLEDDGE